MDECETCAIKYLAEFSEKHDLPWQIGKNGWLYHKDKELDASTQAHDYDNLIRCVEKEAGKKNFAKIKLDERLPYGGAVLKVRYYHRRLEKWLRELRIIRIEQRKGRMCGGIA